MFATPEFLTKSISAASDGIINQPAPFFTVSPLRNVIAYITLPRIMQIKAQCLILFNSLAVEYRFWNPEGNRELDLLENANEPVSGLLHGKRAKESDNCAPLHLQIGI